VRTLFLVYVDDFKDYLILEFIIAFCRTVIFGVKTHWVKNTFIVILGEDTGQVVVEVAQDRGQRECLFEEIEGSLLLQSPNKWDVFAFLLFNLLVNGVTTFK